MTTEGRRQEISGKSNSRFCALLLLSYCLLLSTNVKAQDTAKVNAYYDLVKTWGVLKYYSPIVNKGKTDWDSVLISKFELISNEGPDSFYRQLDGWVKFYAPGYKARVIKDTIVSGLKNVDSLSLKRLEALTVLKVAKGYYFHGSKGCNYANLPCFVNEKNYTDKDLWRKEIRFLTLARLWNTVQYFYPYKDILPEKWDSVLLKFIPAVLNVKNPEVFQFLLLKLGVALHDTHTHINGGALGFVWEKKLPAIAIKWVENKAVITAVYDDSIAKIVQIGSVVLQIEGEPADSLVHSLAVYASGDNEVQKANSLLFDFILAGKAGSTLTLKVADKEGNTKEFQFERKLTLGEIEKAVQKRMKPSTALNDSIGYINMGNTNEKDWLHIMKGMHDAKGLVVDLREYPQWALQALHIYLLKKGCLATLNKTPDLHHPGKFLTYKNAAASGREKFKGRVVVLISEGTISRGEYFAMLLKQCGRDVTFVGTQTAGAVGTYTSAYLPGSIMISYTGTGEFYDNHGTAQISGIVPDIIVNQTIKGFQSNKDEVLERAVLFLQGVQKN